MKKTKTKTYPLEFKQSSAQLAVDSAQPISQTARDLGVNPTTLYGWVAKFHPNHDQAKQSSADSVNEELKQLRQENIRLKQERDILKKAAAYFASKM